MKIRKPSTTFLVLLNGFAFFALLIPGLTPMMLALAPILLAIFLGLSGLWQLIWFYLDRRFRFHNAIRCIGFMLPVCALLAHAYLVEPGPNPINRQYPAISQSGKYSAYFKATYNGWVVEIQDPEGGTLHQELTEMIPDLAVYWLWDAKDHLWLYNSDDAGVHCWQEQSDKTWLHILWGYGSRQETRMDIGNPPDELHPDYARQPARIE